MIDIFCVLVIAHGSAGIALLMGQPENAGLMGAIIGVGVYACRTKSGAV